MPLVKRSLSAPRPIAKVRGKDDDLGMPKDDRDESLGWYLRRLLIQEDERGVSQVEIAEKVGVTQPVISNIINAKSLPALKTAILLAAYFRRSPGELLDEALEWWEKRGGRDDAMNHARDAFEKRRSRTGTDDKK